MAIRRKRSYEILISKISTDLSITDIQSVSWDGENLLFRQSDITNNNNPVAGVKRITQRFEIVPFGTIYQTYFSSIARPRFKNVGVEFDNPQTTITFRLTVEDR